MKNRCKKLIVDSKKPDAAAVEKAAAIIRSGGVVVFPTRNLYGLGADATNPDAVSRVFAIKKRSAHKPLSVLVPRKSDICALAADFPPAGKKIADRLWPGGVTMVFHARNHLPSNLTAGTGKIGIRLPRHPFAAALLYAVDGPVTATSANLSGEPGCSRIEDLPEAVYNDADLIIDAGVLPGGPGSTVVDITTDPPEILREGSVETDRIFAAIQR